MGDLPDPEKPAVAAASTPSLTFPVPDQDAAHTSHASTTDTNPSLDKEPTIHPIPSRTSSSSDSINSIDSDPLEPLERALTSDQQTPAEHLSRPFRSYTGTSAGTNGSRLPNFEVDFEPDDPRNPRNWPAWYRGIVLATISYSTWVVVLYSTSYTSGLPMMMEEFGETNATLATLGVTTYLFGLAVGSVILAPLSEIWGRRPIYVCTMGIFTLLMLPCALGTSMWEIILVRFFGGLAGSAMIANAPGTVMDISREETRALAFSIWSIGPMNGPITGPLIGGFAAQYLGWRWTNWIAMILGGAAWISTSALAESYAPAVLQKMAAERRKETGDDRWWCRYDVKLNIGEMLRINMSRPFVLMATEPILWFWDLYIAVVYGILYLCFVAYPIIFSQHRGWGPGFTGLAFSGIGIGTMITICTEPLQRRIINRHPKEPATGKVAPEASVSMVCIAALLVPIGQLWFSWASYPITIHWIWSILAGVPFGMGNGLVFIYAGNYIAGSYGIYSASAMAGNTVVRSVIGGTLPLAGTVMFARLGINWAGTMLGLLEVLLIPIPFVFYKWGSKIRARSPVIRKMREDQERIDRRAARKGDARGDVEKTALDVGLTQTVSRVN